MFRAQVATCDMGLTACSIGLAFLPGQAALYLKAAVPTITTSRELGGITGVLNGGSGELGTRPQGLSTQVAVLGCTKEKSGRALLPGCFLPVQPKPCRDPALTRPMQGRSEMSYLCGRSVQGLERTG